MQGTSLTFNLKEEKYAALWELGLQLGWIESDMGVPIPIQKVSELNMLFQFQFQKFWIGLDRNIRNFRIFGISSDFSELVLFWNIRNFTF